MWLSEWLELISLLFISLSLFVRSTVVSSLARFSVYDSELEGV